MSKKKELISRDDLTDLTLAIASIDTDQVIELMRQNLNAAHDFLGEGGYLQASDITELPLAIVKGAIRLDAIQYSVSWGIVVKYRCNDIPMIATISLYGTGALDLNIVDIFEANNED